MSPLLTIVTVVRNNKAGLEATIDSIKNIKTAQVEYLVIDGGSTDGTLDVIATQNDVIDLWISEKDNGIYDAMNKGASLAKGEWIWFMNAGDYVHDSNVLDRLAPYLDGTADVILGACQKVLVDKYQTRHFLDRPSDLNDLWTGMPTCHQAVIVRTMLQKEFGFNTDYRWCADFDFLVRLNKSGHEFISMQEPLCIYDCTPGEQRSPSLYILERWKASKGLVSARKRLLFYGGELMNSYLSSPVVKLWHWLAPEALILRMRKIRRTG